MKPISRHNFVEIMLLALIMITGATAAPTFVVDQQNSVPAQGSQGGVVFGQSFTPTLPSIDIFEIVIGDSQAMVATQILDGVNGFDGLGGLVLGTSNLVLVNTNGRQPIQFDFPGGIPLTPGHTYVARVFASVGESAPGIEGISITTDNSYPGGQLLEGGFSATLPYLTEYDSIFREGVTTPEPRMAWVLGFLLLAAIGYRAMNTAAKRSYGADRE